MPNDYSAFERIKVLCIDLDCPLPDLILQGNKDCGAYQHAMILVRLHQQPLGLIDIDIPQHGLDRSTLAYKVEEILNLPIRDHVALDGPTMPDFSLSDTNNQKLGTLSDCLQAQQVLLEENTPFVSVVIATRDRLESLKECIASLLELDYPAFEIVVVDNAPVSDDTENYIRSLFFDSVKIQYIREDVPGLAMAHNHALRELGAEIVAFTDDDVLVDRSWLKFIVQNFQRDPKIACVTGMILPYEIETYPQLWIEQFGGFGKGFQRICFDMNENHPNDILFPYSAGRFGSGANMAFRTSALRAIGGFDTSLGAGTPAKGGDDLAVFFDVIVAGYRLIYEPGALLYHKHRRDYAGLANQAFGYGVGLSAFLIRTIVKYPKLFTDILVRIPAGLKHLLNPRSSKNKKKQYDYPSELTKLELRGFIWGPFAYLQSIKYKQKTITQINSNKVQDPMIG